MLVRNACTQCVLRIEQRAVLNWFAQSVALEYKNNIYILVTTAQICALLSCFLTHASITDILARNRSCSENTFLHKVNTLSPANHYPVSIIVGGSITLFMSLNLPSFPRSCDT